MATTSFLGPLFQKYSKYFNNRPASLSATEDISFAL